MSLVRCPTCEKQFDPAESRAMPFCSARCRAIDLNRWLSEDISIPRTDEDKADDKGRSPARDHEDN